MIKKPSLYINSTSGFCGKSIISLGLALKFQELGYKIGYLKPIGWEMRRNLNGEKIDEDAELMASVLDLKLPMDFVVPIIFGARFLEETAKIDKDLEEKILKAYQKLAKDKDLIIIEGPYNLGVGNCIGIDPISLSHKLNSSILIVSRFQNDINIDHATWVSKMIDELGGNIIGLILNRVPRNDIERIRRFTSPIFKKCGINLLGIIPENIEIMAPTVREICEQMKCEVVTAEKNLDNLVEDILVGAMSPESCLSYFRRSFRKAVITGGDRPDVQLAALETNLSALILTGNLYPDARVLSRAEDLGVPVLLVPWDTYTTVRHISSLTGRIKPQDKNKIRLAKKLIEDNVEWRKILTILNPE